MYCVLRWKRLVWVCKIVSIPMIVYRQQFCTNRFRKCQKINTDKEEEKERIFLSFLRRAAFFLFCLLFFAGNLLGAQKWINNWIILQNARAFYLQSVKYTLKRERKNAENAKKNYICVWEIYDEKFFFNCVLSAARARAYWLLRYMNVMCTNNCANIKNVARNTRKQNEKNNGKREKNQK